MLVVGDLLRKHELQSGKFTLTGATWVLIAATLSLGVFPPAVGVPAFCVLIVSDTFAALIGRRYGVRKFLDKSVVGTSTFIVTGCMVVATFGLLYTLPISYYLAGSLGAVCAGIAEAAAVRFRVDDNIAIPLSMAATMIIAEKLLHGVGLPLFSQLIQ